MKKILSIASSVYICLIISGCSSTPDEAEKLNTPETKVETSQSDNSIKNVEQHLSEWKKMKPSLERLVLIEDELKIIIQEMNRMAVEQKKIIAEQKDKPKPTVLPQTVKAESAALPQSAKVESAALPQPAKIESMTTPNEKSSVEQKASKPVVAANKEAPSYSKYALQIFTVENGFVLKRAWKLWSKKYGDIIGKYKPIYQEVKGGNTTYFRVKIKNFITKKDARETCLRLKKEGGDCFITNNLGKGF